MVALADLQVELLDKITLRRCFHSEVLLRLSDVLATWIATSRVEKQRLLLLTHDAEAKERAMWNQQRL